MSNQAKLPPFKEIFIPTKLIMNRKLTHLDCCVYGLILMFYDKGLKIPKNFNDLLAEALNINPTETANSILNLQSENVILIDKIHRKIIPIYGNGETI